MIQHLKFNKLKNGRVSSLKLFPLLRLQLPLEFILTTFQLTWCASCLCSVIDVVPRLSEEAGGVHARSRV